MAKILRRDERSRSTNEAKFAEHDAMLKNQAATLANLERHVGEIVSQLSERAPGKLPSNTETNPRGFAKAVTIRSGVRARDEPVIQEVTTGGVVEEPVMDRDEEQNAKFLELLKQLYLNFPFLEALTQMPKYAKFLKEIFTNKQKLAEVSFVPLSVGCSAILQSKLPKKMAYPGSFMIPCILGDDTVSHALADLGASINLMPYFVFSRLGLTEQRPTRISIQLADRSVKYPRGIVENMLVRIGKFIFPVDFFILDMNEGDTVALILGRPFLATAQALIDVRDGKLIL
ncbi:uncharacterized protein LOC143624312 [Bidens hawaiensis]|uniref:uncharacterized protein LOC143624312 n=1 Tax=Bidens hawaiensis TaxID=980011 RepID=UPI004049387E